MRPDRVEPRLLIYSQDGLGLGHLRRTTLLAGEFLAARPDGSRRAFKPYPTPLFAKDGSFTGAVNVLIDVTDEQAEMLHEQAERCRRLAGALYSRESSDVLRSMANGFEQTAEDLERKHAR